MGTVDPVRARIIDKFKVAAIIEKKLRNQKRCACIDLSLEIVEVHCRIAALDVLFGIAALPQREGVAVSLPDKGGQFIGVAEAAFGRDKTGLAFGRIASQGEDILNTCFVEAIEN